MLPKADESHQLSHKRDQFLRHSSNDPLEDYVLKEIKKGSTSVDTSLCPLLRLPMEVHYKHFRELRSACQTIANDIDYHLGISAVVDEREREFDDHFESLAIRHATIKDLSSPRIIAHLLHPELLLELTVKGSISSAFFSYFMDSCRNISSITLNFNKFLLHTKPQLFPQQNPCLPNLKTLKVIAHTKKEKDLAYVCENLLVLIEDLAQTSRKIVELNFNLSHKSPSNYLDLIVLYALMLAHKSSTNLQEFHLQARESCVIGGEDDDGGRGGGTGAGGSTRRATEMVKSKKSVATTSATEESTSSQNSSQVDSSKSNRKYSDTMQSTEKFLSRSNWPIYPFMKTAVITLTSTMFAYIQEMLTKVDKVRHLKLEICGGAVSNCWATFENIVGSTSQTLTVIKLHNINYEDYRKNPLDLDFSIFKPCKSLKHLHLSCVKRENKHLPKAKNISSLPRSLIDIELLWLTLSSWQWFRLLHSFNRMESLRVGYTSRTEKSFGYFLFVLRWLIILKMTKTQMVLITDFKIKFRNKRTALKKLRKAVPVQIEYLDKEETLLIVDRGQARHSAHSIPSIDSGE